MGKYYRIIGILVGVLTGVLACMEIHPITPPKGEGGNGNPPNVDTTCKAPSLTQNIVGSWHFESTYNPDYSTTGKVTSGTVTFTAQGTIIDPDSLFENTVDRYPVQAKTYVAETIVPTLSYTGKVFIVYLKIPLGTNIYYFTEVSNECDRIHLRQFLSANNGIGFVLTRLK